MKKLMIAIPTLDYIHWKFADSLVKLCRFLGLSDIEHDVCFEGCTLVHVSRDRLAKKAIEGNYEYVLWLDADMVFPQSIFQSLEMAGLDFVSAYYVGRHGDNKPVFYDSLLPVKRWDKARLEKISLDEPIRIAGCGFGCVLVKTDILRKVMDKYGTCFTPTPQLGEDVAFCHRAMELGYDIWVRPDAWVGHISHSIVSPYGAREPI